MNGNNDTATSVTGGPYLTGSPYSNASIALTFNPRNETSTELQKCVADQRPYRVAAIITALIAMLVEVYILICLLLRRKVLVRSVVNAYAINVVIVNFLTTSFDFVNALYGFPTVDNMDSVDYVKSVDVPFALYLWLFFKVVEAVVHLALPFSLALLIGAVQSHLFEIHRMVAGMNTKISKLQCCKLRLKKRTRAIVLITLTWVGIGFVTMVTMLDNECFLKCRCPYHYSSVSNSFDPCPFENGPDDCHVFWYPLNNKSSIVAVIAWILFTVIDIIFLMYAFYKFANVLNDHKKSAVLRRPARPKASCSFARQSMDSASIETKTMNCDDPQNNVDRSKNEFATMEENNDIIGEDGTNNNDVIEQRTTDNNYVIDLKTTDDLKVEEEKQTNAASFAHPRKDSTRLHDVRRTRSRAVPNINYEDIKFTNVFLLARLKRNLQFLCLILFVAILGQGAAVAVTFASAVDYEILYGDDKAIIRIVVFVPAAIVEAIICIIICNTTSSLRSALQSTTRRIFFACRISKY